MMLPIHFLLRKNLDSEYIELICYLILLLKKEYLRKMGAFSTLSAHLFGIFIVYLLLSFDSSLIEAKRGRSGGRGVGTTVVLVNNHQAPVPAGGGQSGMHCCGNAFIGCSDQGGVSILHFGTF
ncbi:hypothetical protein Ddc_18062 [Ditylenchus destructor]|nr:hypothetical protein Ddc_18062 [Ditylenchus destructor]